MFSIGVIEFTYFTWNSIFAFKAARQRMDEDIIAEGDFELTINIFLRFFGFIFENLSLTDLKLEMLGAFSLMSEN